MTNILKGFIIGIGKIIPGVSGALLAISLGVYDKSIYYINNFRCNKKESTKYLFPIILGIIISIIFFSKIINYLLDEYYVLTMLFFTGLIIGTIPNSLKEVNKKDYYLVAISFLIFFLFSLLGTNNIYVLKGNIVDMVVLFISGLLEALGTVVPGISSTALLMTVGTYKIIISSLASLSNIKIIIPFCIGTIIGLLSIIKIIDYLFKKYHHKIYAVILGLLLSTIVIMIINTFKYPTSLLNIFIAIVLMIIGIFISSIFKK